MSKRAIFFASTAAGIALFGAIGFMQQSRGAFTSEPRVDLDAYLYSEVPARLVQPAPAAIALVAEPAVLVLPALHIVAKSPRTVTLAAPHAPTMPCSPWREIGPRNVTDGVPTGTLQVRDLC